MEEIDKYEFMIDEYTSNEWIWEIINWNCMVINRRIKTFIDFEFLRFDNIFVSWACTKCSQSEFSIINISNGKIITSLILFNFFQLNIFSLNFFIKSSLANVKVILLNKVFCITFLCNCHCRSWVICDHYRNQRTLGDNICRPSKSSENIIKIPKSPVWLNIRVSIGTKCSLLLFNLKLLFILFYLFLQISGVRFE